MYQTKYKKQIYDKSLVYFLIFCMLFLSIFTPVNFVLAEGLQDESLNSDNEATDIAMSDDKTKTEIAYGSLSNDGKLKSVYVINQFESKDNKPIIDYGNYQELRALSGAPDSIKQDADKITIANQPGRIWYQGDLQDRPLPWLFTIEYKLNGKAIMPDELSGAEGDLTISFKVTQNTQVQDIFYRNYVLQISVPFNPDLTSDIVAKDAIMAVSGNHILANFMILPNAEQKEYVITAKIKNFAMDPIQIGAVPLTLDFKMPDIGQLLDPLQELETGIAEVAKGSKELLTNQSLLKSGGDDLKLGSQQILDGSLKLSDSIKKLRPGFGEYLAGVNQYSNSVDQVYDGSKDLSAGLDQLVSGMHQISSYGLQLTDGSKNILQGLNDFSTKVPVIDITGLPLKDEEGNPISAVTQFNELLVAAQQINDSLQAMNSGLGKLKGGIEFSDNILQSVMASLEQLPEQAPQAMDADAWIAYLGIDTSSGLTVNEQKLLQALVEQSAIANQQTQSLIQIKTAIDASHQLLDAILHGSTEEPENSLTALIEGFDELTKGYAEFLQGLQQTVKMAEAVDQISEKLPEMQSGMAQLKAGLEYFANEYKAYDQGLNHYIDSIRTLTLGMDNADESEPGFKQGLDALTDGLGQLAGVDLQDGGNKLSDGVNQLSDGMTDFSSGIDTFDKGAEKYTAGVDQYLDGVKQLVEANQLLKEKTTGMSDKSKKQLSEELKKYEFGDIEIPSYVSEKNNKNIKNVQFVMLTEGIKGPKQVEENVKDKGDDRTFWQRLKDLF